jgi:hypothetical protein
MNYLLLSYVYLGILASLMLYHTPSRHPYGEGEKFCVLKEIFSMAVPEHIAC